MELRFLFIMCRALFGYTHCLPCAIWVRSFLALAPVQTKLELPIVDHSVRDEISLEESKGSRSTKQEVECSPAMSQKRDFLPCSVKRSLPTYRQTEEIYAHSLLGSIYGESEK